jgi:hypothetical protein
MKCGEMVLGPMTPFSINPFFKMAKMSTFFHLCDNPKMNIGGHFISPFMVCAVRWLYKAPKPCAALMLKGSHAKRFPL